VIGATCRAGAGGRGAESRLHRCIWRFPPPGGWIDWQVAALGGADSLRDRRRSAGRHGRPDRLPA
jgi:hypothetical protein